METNDLEFLTDNTSDLKQDDRVVGAYLFDKFNEMLGRIKGVLVDPESHQVRYAVFTDGGFLFTEGKTVLIPHEHYEMLDMGKVRVNWSRESLQHAPTINDIEAISRNEESVILSYFDIEPYWDAPPLPSVEDPIEEDDTGDTQEKDFEIPTTGLDEEITGLDIEPSDDKPDAP